MYCIEPVPVILFVDDNPHMRTYVSSLVKKTHPDDVALLCVGSVALAQKALELSTPTFIVLDFKLGDGTALDVIETIIERDIPYALMTGFSEDGMRSECNNNPVLDTTLANAQAIILKDEVGTWLMDFLSALAHLAYREQEWRRRNTGVPARDVR